MNKSGETRRFTKPLMIAAGAAIFLVIVLIAGQLWFEHKLRGMIENLETGIYKTEVGSVNVRLIGRTVEFKDVTIKSTVDSVRIDSSQLRSLDVAIEQLDLKGIGIRKRNGKYILNFRKINIKFPRGILEQNQFKAAKSGDKHLNLKISLYDRIMERVQSLSAGEVNVEAGHLEYDRHFPQEIIKYEADNLFLRIGDMLIDSTTKENFLSGESFQASLGKISYKFNEGSVVFTSDSIEVDTKQRMLSIASLSVIPIYHKYEYAVRVKNHADWTRFKTGRIELAGVDYDAILSDNLISIESINVTGVDVQSYKNRKIYQTPEIKGSFYKSLQKFPVKIAIPVVNVNNVTVAYEELAAEGNTPGRIFLTGLNAKFINLTNIVTKDKPYVELTAHGKLMGAGDMQTTIKMPVDPLNNHVEVSGKIGSMDMVVFNEIVEPIANMKIESGRINSLNFQAQGTEEASQVKVQFLYDDLSVSLLKEKDDLLIKRKLLSTIVNEFVLRSDNPDKNGREYEGSGSFVRDPYKSQYNYLWKSIYPGIKDIVLKI